VRHVTRFEGDSVRTIGHHRSLGARRGLHGLELRGARTVGRSENVGRNHGFLDLIRTARRIGVVESNLAKVDMLHALRGGGITLDRDQRLQAGAGRENLGAAPATRQALAFARPVEDRAGEAVIKPFARRIEGRAHILDIIERIGTPGIPRLPAATLRAQRAAGGVKAENHAACRIPVVMNHHLRIAPSRSGLSGQRRQIIAARSQLRDRKLNTWLIVGAQRLFDRLRNEEASVRMTRAHRAPAVDKQALEIGARAVGQQRDRRLPEAVIGRAPAIDAQRTHHPRLRAFALIDDRCAVAARIAGLQHERPREKVVTGRQPHRPRLIAVPRLTRGADRIARLRQRRERLPLRSVPALCALRHDVHISR